MKRIKQNIEMDLGNKKTTQNTDVDADKKKKKRNTDMDEGKKKNRYEPKWQDGTLTVEEIKAILQLSKAKTYELVNRGEFPVIRIDNVIRIPQTGFDKWFRENCA